jgi:hypothetical protein
MNELIKTEPPKLENEPGSDVKRFLAVRGTLLVKEFRDVNTVPCEYGSTIKITTAILSAMQKGSEPNKPTFGVRLEGQDMQGDDIGTAFLDFDEFQEVIGAIEYIGKMASELRQQGQDYTEVEYITKDDMKFGFFQKDGRQLGFWSLNYRGMIFLSLEMLEFMKKNIQFAKDYLASRGAR